MNKQYNPLGWELGGTGWDWGLGTYTWRCSTMNKQPFRLKTAGDSSFKGTDLRQQVF